MLRRRDALSDIQQTAVNVLQQRLKTALWSKPGSGKTIIALTAASELHPGLSLIVGTKRIAELVWRQEALQWEHTAHLDFTLLFGSPKKRSQLLTNDFGYHLINYELLPWLADEYRGQDWPYEAVIFDEISKMKTPGSVRFKKLKHPLQKIPIRFGLTGTPRGNSMLGLWSQTYCLNGPALAKSHRAYKARWFFPVDKEMRIWKPMAGSEAEIREAMKPYAHATPKEAAAPEAKLNIVPVKMPPKVWDQYRELEIELELEVDGERIVAIEPSQQKNKLLQIASGAAYVTDKESEEQRYVILHDAKLEAIDEILDELQGDQLLIMFRYRHELDRLEERYGDALCGIDDVNDWIAGKYQIIAVHPASAAHGLNLHVGGCSTQLWFTMPDSQELWEQGNRRLARKGQERDVIAHILTVAGSREEANLKATLDEHGRLQDKLIDCVRI